MSKRICPRCGRSIPVWQPIHLSCFINRAKYLIIILSSFISILILGIIGFHTGFSFRINPKDAIAPSYLETPRTYPTQGILTSYSPAPSITPPIQSSPEFVSLPTATTINSQYINASIPTLSLSGISSTSTQISSPTTIPPILNTMGRIVFTCQIFSDDLRNQICIINPDGSGFKRLSTDNYSNYFYPSIAPDGQSILVSRSEDGIYDLWEIDILGHQKQLTNGPGSYYAPEMSPDGNSIVYTYEINQHQTIWVMKIDGTDKHIIYDNPLGDSVDPAWSPDGNKILFASGPNSNVQLYIIDKYGSALQQVTDIAGLRGRSDWSPDGQTIATYVGETWHREIYLLNIDGTNLRKITDGGNNLAPSFSPDGQWIVYTSYRDLYGDDQGCELYKMRLDGTDIKRLTNNSYCDWQPRWGP